MFLVAQLSSGRGCCSCLSPSLLQGSHSFYNPLIEKLDSVVSWQYQSLLFLGSRPDYDRILLVSIHIENLIKVVFLVVFLREELAMLCVLFYVGLELHVS